LNGRVRTSEWDEVLFEEDNRDRKISFRIEERCFVGMEDVRKKKNGEESWQNSI
jgi:hypothetical protein